MTFGPPTYTDLHFGHLFSLPPEAGLQPQHGTLTSGTFGFTGAFALGHTPHRTCHSVSFVLGTASSGPIEIQWRVAALSGILQQGPQRLSHVQEQSVVEARPCALLDLLRRAWLQVFPSGPAVSA